MKTYKKLQQSVSSVLSISVILAASSTLVKAGEQSPHWSYGEAVSPTQWGRLGHDFASCELGRDQSPINIDNPVVGAPGKIEFNYVSAPLVVVNNGHTVQVNYAPGSTATINGKKYELVQFHFHTPSEHTLSGKASAMELHLVHRNAAGELAVVGVMLKQGVMNSTIDAIWKHIPKGKGINTIGGVTINAASLLPTGTSYFSYGGSLTTPPCSEGVKWNILAEPIQISEEQIATFESLYQVNARPVQPTNGRVIEIHK